MQVLTNIVSSLEKCRRDLSASDYKRLTSISALRGEHVNFQIICSFSELEDWERTLSFETVSNLGNIRIRAVKDICVNFETYPSDPSIGTDKMLSFPAGRYPDILEGMRNGNKLSAVATPVSVWVDLVIPRDASEGIHKIEIKILNEKNECLAQESIDIDVIPAHLPRFDGKCTLWFHVDCLSDYYGAPMYSERHFEIIENYMKNAVSNSINTILVPALTPPLDTAVGTYRPTTQLIKVRCPEEGKYAFEFSLFDRFIDLAKKCGFEYFEISHFFSQWGAKYAPKVVADVFDRESGEWCEKRIFGWDTPGTEGEYPKFIEQYIPSLRAHLEELGILDSCMFHISDEPTLENIDGYKAAKELAAPFLEGLKVVDACGHIEVARDGLVEIPIPNDVVMDDFLALDLPERWTYYCCIQMDNAPNRFVAYPSFRNRILGIIMYKYNITGFLQWAYNFYYNQSSTHMINPYTDATGEGWVPAGDTFMVYPGADGNPVESLRLPVFAEAFSDIMALKVCEEKCGREAVLSVIDRMGEITFKSYPTSGEYIIETRRIIGEMIKNNI